MNYKFFSIIPLFLLCSCNSQNQKYDASGVFETTEIIISSKVAGEIMRLDVEEGQDVAVGDFLGYVDTTQISLNRQRLELGLKGMSYKKIDIIKQVAGLQEQIATAKKEQKRFQTLVKQNVANQKQLDDIKSQIATLEKQLDAQVQQLEQSNDYIDKEQDDIIIQIALLDDMIMNSKIISPVSGTVVAKYAEAGELANIGRTLLKIADLKKMYLRAYLSAEQVNELKIGQAVKVFADKGEDSRREYNGIVTWISQQAEFTPKTVQTRDERSNLIYAVKIAVNNDGYIKRGMYGDISIN